jgi:hypothetical protein
VTSPFEFRNIVINSINEAQGFVSPCGGRNRKKEQDGLP